MIKTARDMPSFLDQDRPKKVKEIYSALKRDHPDMPAEMKARIAARQGKKGKQKQGPPYKAPITTEYKEAMSPAAKKALTYAGLGTGLVGSGAWLAHSLTSEAAKKDRAKKLASHMKTASRRRAIKALAERWQMGSGLERASGVARRKAISHAEGRAAAKRIARLRSFGARGKARGGLLGKIQEGTAKKLESATRASAKGGGLLTKKGASKKSAPYQQSRKGRRPIRVHNLLKKAAVSKERRDLMRGLTRLDDSPEAIASQKERRDRYLRMKRYMKTGKHQNLNKEAEFTPITREEGTTRWLPSAGLLAGGGFGGYVTGSTAARLASLARLGRVPSAVLGLAGLGVGGTAGGIGGALLGAKLRERMLAKRASQGGQDLRSPLMGGTKMPTDDSKSFAKKQLSKHQSVGVPEVPKTTDITSMIPSSPGSINLMPKVGEDMSIKNDPLVQYLAKEAQEKWSMSLEDNEADMPTGKEEQEMASEPPEMPARPVSNGVGGFESYLAQAFNRSTQKRKYEDKDYPATSGQVDKVLGRG